MVQTSVEIVNPGGTGRPALVISARPEPLPPSVSFIVRSPSAFPLPKKYTCFFTLPRRGAVAADAGLPRRSGAAAEPGLPRRSGTAAEPGLPRHSGAAAEAGLRVAFLAN